MSARKSTLIVALTVIALLSMLVPAAIAAPEWAHGVTILEPVKFFVDPTVPGVAADPDKRGDDIFKINYNITVVGTQVHDVDVAFWLQDAKNIIAEPVHTTKIEASTLKTGPNDAKYWFVVPATVADGWYDLYVCVEDTDAFDPAPEPFCDVAADAVLVDRVAPTVSLVSPLPGAWLTGTQVLLVGRAEDGTLPDNRAGDSWGIDTTVTPPVFQYRADPNDDWITLPVTVTKSNVPNEWYAYWNSTLVPDDDEAANDAEMRFCAGDLVGHWVCSDGGGQTPTVIHVENRYSISLQAGWNLISTPLILYDNNTLAALLHLKARDAVANIETPSWNAIYAVTNKDAGEPDVYDWSWKKSPEAWPYAPDVVTVPGDLNTLDHGRGFWIHMKTVDTLTFVGTWKSTGPIAPPEYGVFEGWNLIGYTHWGQPTAPDLANDQTVAEYLGSQVIGGVESLWRYDAASQHYEPVGNGDLMIKGAGYWLALSDGGTINP